MKNLNIGFTLIELLISVALVGILAGIAYPSYLENVKKTKRSEAKAALLSLANALELWNLNHKNITPEGVRIIPEAGKVFSDKVPVTGGNKTYSLEISALDDNSYTLKAVSVEGDRCDPLTYDNFGQKTAGDENCW